MAFILQRAIALKNIKLPRILDEKALRFDNWLGFKRGSTSMALKYVRRFSNQVLFDHQKNDYEYDFKFSYEVNEHFMAYFQVTNLKVNPTSNLRQTRFRAGFLYSF